ncbi:MAG: ADP-ribosylation factor-like protein [Promethearchaeota archaeon]
MMTSLKKKKIIVLGLEKSGKTSIVFNFIGKFNLSDYNSLGDTKSPNIFTLEKSDIEFSLWDFKGEEVYRNEFLNNFNSYINNTREIFFVIDVQDSTRYDLAIKFLQTIIMKLKRLNLKVEFTIFLHKYDNNLFERFPDLKREMIQSLIERIKQIIPSDDFHEIYQSNINMILDKIHIF